MAATSPCRPTTRFTRSSSTRSTGPWGAWDITPLSDNPERARAQAQGIVYWQGRHVDQADGALLKCYVGEDWVVERVPSGELKFVIYVNSFHRFLPDAAPIEIR